MATGQNIRKLRTLLGWTLEKLSERSGVDVGTISALENRDSARSKYFPSIANAFGITSDMLAWNISDDQITRAIVLSHQMRDDDPKLWPSAKEIVEIVFDQIRTPDGNSINYVDSGENRLPIRRALFKLSAGVSGYEIEYENGESEPIFMARRWFEKNHYRPEKLIALKVQGRSMEPKMYDGDLVIVNTESATPKDGVVFAVNYEGELVIKRMKRDSGQWFITSDNPDKIRFGDKVCADACFLLGEVVYLQTETI